jgi:hypothetical protein
MWECLECPRLEHCDERAYLKDLNRKRVSWSTTSHVLPITPSHFLAALTFCSSWHFLLDKTSWSCY